MAACRSTGLSAHVPEDSGQCIVRIRSVDEEYHKLEILGFTVHLSAEDMRDRTEIAEPVLWMTHSKLQRIIEVIPMNKINLIQQVEL